MELILNCILWRSNLAKRYIYTYDKNSYKKDEIEFEWYSGFSIKQKQKSIEALHKEAYKKGRQNILEVSSASTYKIGVAASAFNLELELKNGSRYTVEVLFQSSKVFDKSGTNSKVLEMNPRNAKKYTNNLHSKEELIGFNFFGRPFPLLPETYFYNWLYVNALFSNKDLLDNIVKYDAFTDISFNPQKSINCQAESCSVAAFLKAKGVLSEQIRNPKSFFELVYPNFCVLSDTAEIVDGKNEEAVQISLFDDLSE